MRKGKCPKCESTVISADEGILPGKWFNRDFKIKIFHCESCGYMELYHISKEFLL